MAVKMGVKIGFGTDSAVSPHGINAREFALMTGLGMPAIATLKSATSVDAELLGITAKTGTIEPGKLADVIAMPGELDPTLRAVLGPWTIEFLEGLNLEVALISGAGITLESGLMTSHRQLADMLRHVVRKSQKVYVLIDSTKFGRTALLSIVEPWAVAGVITDSALDPAR